MVKKWVFWLEKAIFISLMQSTITILLAEYEALIADNKQLNEKLTQGLFQLAELQRMIFGTKSERFIQASPLPSAPTLFDLPQVAEIAEPLTKAITVHTRRDYRCWIVKKRAKVAGAGSGLTMHHS